MKEKSNFCSTSFLYERRNPQTFSGDEKFLFAVLPNGPNNQVESFFESYEVANALNMSFVLPPMFRHKSDSNNDDPYIPLKLRLDADYLRKTRPRLVDADDAFYQCGYKITKALYTKNRLDKSVTEKFQKYYGIKNQNFPKLYNPKLAEYKMQFLSNDQIRQFYQNEIKNHKCVLLVGSFKSVLHRRIEYDELKFPKFIYDYADEFSKNTVYDFTFHYRYNKEDWGKRCMNNIRSRNENQCEMVNNGLTSKVIATAILEVAKDCKKSVCKIHIAAPPSEQNFIEKVIKSMKKSSRLEISSSYDVEKFFMQFRKCQLLKHYKAEVISAVEQAVLEKSHKFYYWPLSTWSERIQELRILSTGLETDNFVNEIVQIQKS